MLISKAYKLCNGDKDLYLQVKRLVSVNEQERIQMWSKEYVNDIYKHHLADQIKSILDQLNLNVIEKLSSLKRRFNLPE